MWQYMKRKLDALRRLRRLRGKRRALRGLCVDRSEEKHHIKSNQIAHILRQRPRPTRVKLVIKTEKEK